jgi:hypothetical protein
MIHWEAEPIRTENEIQGLKSQEAKDLAIELQHQFQDLRRPRVRIDTLDLKIASIAWNKLAFIRIKRVKCFYAQGI